VKEILRKIGVKTKIKEIWRITSEKKKSREAVGTKVDEIVKREEIRKRRKN